MKKLSLCFALFLLFCLALTGCSSKKETDDPSSRSSGGDGQEVMSFVTDFFNAVKEGDADAISFAAVKENTPANVSETLKDNMEELWEQDLAAERFQLLLRDTSFEALPLDDYQQKMLSEQHKCIAYVNVKNLKHWDSAMVYYGAQYMLEQGSYDTADMPDAQVYHQLLEKIYDRVPSRDVKIGVDICENKDGSYSIASISLFSLLDIDKAADANQQGGLDDFIYPYVVKPADSDILGPNQKLFLKAIDSYNAMVDAKDFDFNAICEIISSVSDRDQSNSDIAEDIEEAKTQLDWYNSLNEEKKAEVDACLAETGKISYLIYGSYSNYSNELKDAYLLYMIPSVDYLSNETPVFYTNSVADSSVYIYAYYILSPLKNVYNNFS